ncbi:MAG TPA: hypothetical protein VFU63_08600, partial [Ktedonobacterales bacterium]|nr:hypothetical protein [Ktedonobacterales bacterium]
CSLEQLAACARVFARNEQPARGLPMPQLALELAFLECVSVCSGASDSYLLDTMPQARARQSQPTAAATPSAFDDAAYLAKTAPPPPPPAMPPLAANPPASIHDEPPRGKAAYAASAAEQDAPIPEPFADTPAAEAASASVAESAASPLPAHVHPVSQTPAPPVQRDPALLDLLRDIQRRWTMVKKVCKQKSSMVSGLLSDAQPVQIDAGDPPLLVVAVKWPFHLEKLREPSKRESVEWALAQVLERPIRVRLVLASEGGPQPAVRPPDGPQQPPAPPADRPNNATPSNIVPFPTAQSAGAPGATRARDIADAPPAAHVADAPRAASPESQPPDLNALEYEVRADPVIQELLRIGGTELAEVRPLGDDERS